LLELCRQLPGTRVHNETVMAASKMHLADILDQAERTMASVLSARGASMTRSELKAVCSGLGVKRATFYHHLLYSPILVKHEQGVYGLVGWRRRI